MLASLRLVSQLHNELITGESVSDISVFVVAFGWDVHENQFSLLDESTFQLDSLSSLKVKLFHHFFNSLGFLTCFSLLSNRFSLC